MSVADVGVMVVWIVQARVELVAAVFIAALVCLLVHRLHRPARSATSSDVVSHYVTGLVTSPLQQVEEEEESRKEIKINVPEVEMKEDRSCLLPQYLSLSSSLRCQAGGKPVAVLRSSQDARELLSRPAEDFVPMSWSVWLRGRGGADTDSGQWTEATRLLRHPEELSRYVTVDFLEDCTTSALDKVIAELRLLEGELLDPLTLMTSLTFDIIWSLFFGSSPSLKTDHHLLMQAHERLNAMIEVEVERQFLQSDVSIAPDTADAIDDVRSVMFRIFSDAIRGAGNDGVTGNGQGVVRRLLQARAGLAPMTSFPEPTGSSPALVWLLVDIFSEWLEACRRTLSWYLLYLGHLSIFHRQCQHEVDRSLGGHAPTAADGHLLPVTMATLLEVIRLRPPNILTSPLVAINDVTLASGRHIPAGTTSFLHLWCLHHDPDLWPDPDLFNHLRFLQSASEKSTARPLGWLPRVASRVEGEDQLLKTLQLLVVSTLLHNFTLSLPSGGAPQPRERGVVVVPLHHTRQSSSQPTDLTPRGCLWLRPPPLKVTLCARPRDRKRLPRNWLSVPLSLRPESQESPLGLAVSSYPPRSAADYTWVAKEEEEEPEGTDSERGTCPDSLSLSCSSLPDDRSTRASECGPRATQQPCDDVSCRLQATGSRYPPISAVDVRLIPDGCPDANLASWDSGSGLPASDFSLGHDRHQLPVCPSVLFGDQVLGSCVDAFKSEADNNVADVENDVTKGTTLHADVENDVTKGTTLHADTDLEKSDSSQNKRQTTCSSTNIKIDCSENDALHAETWNEIADLKAGYDVDEEEADDDIADDLVDSDEELHCSLYQAALKVV